MKQRAVSICLVQILTATSPKIQKQQTKWCWRLYLPNTGNTVLLHKLRITISDVVIAQKLGQILAYDYYYVLRCVVINEFPITISIWNSWILLPCRLYDSSFEKKICTINFCTSIFMNNIRNVFESSSFWRYWSFIYAFHSWLTFYFQKQSFSMENVNSYSFKPTVRITYSLNKEWSVKNACLHWSTRKVQKKNS